MIAIVAILLLICCLHVYADYRDKSNPRESIFMAIVLFILFCCAVPAFGQGSFYGSQALTVSRSVPVGSSAPVLTLPYSKITICSGSGTNPPTCSAAVTVYADAALTSQLAQPLTADAQGNWGAYMSPGQYVANIVGPSGQQSAVPFSVGGIASTFGILAIENYPGSDLAAKVANALASLGGTSISPIPHAHIVLAPSSSYTTSTVTLPNSTTAPYVTAVDFECQGSSISGTTTAPVIKVLPQNANGAGNGSITGCLLTPVALGTALEVDSRVGYVVSGNIFNGGAIGLNLVNTAFEDGAPGYNEQFSNVGNDYINQTQYGANYAINGGSDSFDYGQQDWTNHFQLLCGSAASHVGGGINMQGAELSGRINTTASTCASGHPALALAVDGAIYRNTVAHWSGEDSGGLGSSNFYFWGGAGSVQLVNKSITVTGMTDQPAPGANPYFNHVGEAVYDFKSPFDTDQCSMVDGEYADGGFTENRPFFADCVNNKRILVGPNLNTSFAMYMLNGTHPFIPQNATQTNSIFKCTKAGCGFGGGYSDLASSGSCLDTAGCNPPFDALSLHSETIVIPGSINRFTMHAETDGMHIDNTDSSSTTPGTPTRPLMFGGYDDSAAPPFLIKPLLNLNFNGGAALVSTPGNMQAAQFSTPSNAGATATCTSGMTLHFDHGIFTGCS